MADRSAAERLTLPHHVAFPSDRWLEAAGRYVREAILGEPGAVAA